MNQKREKLGGKKKKIENESGKQDKILIYKDQKKIKKKKR